jgi:hypothetical protein
MTRRVLSNAGLSRYVAPRHDSNDTIDGTNPDRFRR